MQFKKFNGSTWETVQHKIYGSGTDSLTAFPAMIQAAGEPLIDYTIIGNTVQDGTPTPEAPVDATGCGERTANLVDATMYGTYAPSVGYLSMLVAIPIVTLTSPEGLLTRIVWTNSKNTRIDSSNWIAPENSSTFDLALHSDADCFKIEFRNAAYSILTDEDIARRFDIMLNAGSTALPYEPYGYKLPITSGGVTTNLYLDAPLGAGDTLTYTDTGIALPTVDGDNIISFGTTVQPSAMSATFKGWHPVQGAKTYDGNDWS